MKSTFLDVIKHTFGKYKEKFFSVDLVYTINSGVLNPLTVSEGDYVIITLI